MGRRRPLIYIERENELVQRAGKGDGDAPVENNAEHID